MNISYFTESKARYTIFPLIRVPGRGNCLGGTKIKDNFDDDFMLFQGSIFWLINLQKILLNATFDKWSCHE